MGQNAIVVVEQKSDAGRRQFLPFQQLLSDIQQQVPGNDATLALLQRRLNGVALLARRKKHIRSSQPAAVKSFWRDYFRRAGATLAYIGTEFPSSGGCAITRS